MKILSKAEEEKECTVKGRQYNGELIYYTTDSEAMSKDSWEGVYKCFVSEEEAQRFGYKKSYK
ncbi:MAG: hypothetical protein QF755_03685 [Candidatus Peribacteraceae bacterium]|nr:hypothetical protein [Candidatus Peribacteraceae bacterium]